MQIGDTVYQARWGDVKRGKLIAVDGERAVVKGNGDLYTIYLADLYDTKRAATAAALAYRRKTFRSEFDALKRKIDDMLANINKCIESCEAADE